MIVACPGHAQLCLTHLNKMNFPISIGRTSLFQILGVLVVIFYFNSSFAASYLVLHCLPMSHKKDARLTWSEMNEIS